MKRLQNAVLDTCKKLAIVSILAWPSSVPAAAPDRTSSTYKFWTIQCFNTLDAVGSSTASACELFQDIVESNTGSRILRITINPLPDTQGVRIVFLTPVGVDLHKYFSWKMKVEGGDDVLREDLFRVCLATGCSASFDLKAEEFQRMLTAQSLEISFSLPDQVNPLMVSASLSGLGDAFGEFSDVQ